MFGGVGDRRLQVVVVVDGRTVLTILMIYFPSKVPVRSSKSKLVMILLFVCRYQEGGELEQAGGQKFENNVRAPSAPPNWLDPSKFWCVLRESGALCQKGIGEMLPQ